VKEILADWHNWIPAAGIGILVIGGIIFWLRRKPEDASELERQRRAYLNRVGRIVEGQVLEVVNYQDSSRQAKKNSGLFRKPSSFGPTNGKQKLLYYTYSISGVTYETAQDITGLEAQAHLSRVIAGQRASVKYDPSNPSNSILLADDWSGLH
jgi:hypothetical protein